MDAADRRDRALVKRDVKLLVALQDKKDCNEVARLILKMPLLPLSWSPWASTRRINIWRLLLERQPTPRDAVESTLETVASMVSSGGLVNDSVFESTLRQISSVEPAPLNSTIVNVCQHDFHRLGKELAAVPVVLDCAKQWIAKWLGMSNSNYLQGWHSISYTIATVSIDDIAFECLYAMLKYICAPHLATYSHSPYPLAIYIDEFESLLAKVDPELSEHLENVHVGAALYATRFLICVGSGTALAASHVLWLWDVIFAIGIVRSIDDPAVPRFIVCVLCAIIHSRRALFLERNDTSDLLAHVVNQPALVFTASSDEEMALWLTQALSLWSELAPKQLPVAKVLSTL